MAIVRFKSYAGVLYEVIWETYGLMFCGAHSAEAVLERNLLRGNNAGYFILPWANIGLLLKHDLKRCLKRGVYVHYNEGRASQLGVRQLKGMHPCGPNMHPCSSKRWNVLGAGVGYEDNLVPGEFRVRGRIAVEIQIFLNVIMSANRFFTGRYCLNKQLSLLRKSSILRKML